MSKDEDLPWWGVAIGAAVFLYVVYGAITKEDKPSFLSRISVGACSFGREACLRYKGDSIPATDAISAMNTCDLLSTAYISGPNAHIQASVVADALREKIGVSVRWPQPATIAGMKATLKRECDEFEYAFWDKSRWSNIEKWPQ